MWQYFDRLGSVVTERVELRYPTSILFAAILTAAALLTDLQNAQAVLATRRRVAGAGQVGQIRQAHRVAASQVRIALQGEAVQLATAAA